MKLVPNYCVAMWPAPKLIVLEFSDGGLIELLEDHFVPPLRCGLCSAWNDNEGAGWRLAGAKRDERAPSPGQGAWPWLQERGPRGLAGRLPAVPGVCTSPSVFCSCLWNFPVWRLLPQPPCV